MAAKIDQKAYLQKYLSGPSKEKKKKKKKVIKGAGFKIIDDDIDLSKLRPLDGDELDILDGGEDAPQIAGIIDERPEELKKLEQFNTSSKWRVINEDDGFNSKLQIQEIKKDIKETEKENEIIFGKMYSDSEDEVQKNGSDLSPPRKNKKHDHNSDFSPPRKQISKTNDKSPKRSDNSPKRRDNSPKRRDNSPKRRDNSPKRRNNSPKRRNNSPNRRDQSPKRSGNSDSDISPPRKQEIRRERTRKASRWGDFGPEVSNEQTHKANTSSHSPKRKLSDSDASPPRKMKSSHKDRKRSPSSDLSPTRKDRNNKNRTSQRSKHSKRQDSDSDMSPPRKHRSGTDKHKRNLSPTINRKRQNSDSDMSPPRKKREKSKRNDSDSDLSPPRKGHKKESVTDNKYRKDKRSNQRNDSESDLSPPRKGHRSKETDTSKESVDKRRRRNSDSPPPTNKKMEKTLEGKKAGLQDAKQLRMENDEFRRKEDDVFKKLGEDVLGRNAKAVSRKGKRETSEDRLKQKEKAERQKELDAKYKVWSRGVKQMEAHEARIQDYMHESSKPLARHKDDKDLETNLKQIERAGDPMLEYIREKKRERGELPPEKPSYRGSFPPNRFNIRPGYRWDGVDRSNGYEKKYFEQQSKRKAQEEEAYKWSTEDL